jgi:hypothetical protein
MRGNNTCTLSLRWSQGRHTCSFGFLTRWSIVVIAVSIGRDADNNRGDQQSFSKKAGTTHG